MTILHWILAALAAWTVLSLPAAVFVGRAMRGRDCPGGCS